MKLATRRAALGDEDLLAELNAVVHDLHVAHAPDYFKPVLPAEVATRFRGLLETPTVRIWIADADGAPAGYVAAFLRERPENVFCHPRRWLEINEIAVRPQRRRAGVARALVEVVLRAADADEIAEVELSTWMFNSDAQQAFRRLGFTPRIVRFGMARRHS
jgi:ribosomal protein S18 acetylase RimI-like enzyme